MRFLRYPHTLLFITLRPVYLRVWPYETLLYRSVIGSDDAIGNIQQAINDAYNPSSSRSNDDDDRYDDNRRMDSRQYDDRRRQLEDRRRRLDERQRQLDDDRRRLEEDERRLEDDYDRG